MSITAKVTNLLYIDDRKVFAASEVKLNMVLRVAKGAIDDVGLEWNEKKCNVVHVRKGIEVNATRFKAGQLKVDCICCHDWAQHSDVVQCCRSVQSIKGIGCVNQ